MTVSTPAWTPDSWLAKSASQQPTYPDQEKVKEVFSELSRLPPLVTSWEIEALRGELAKAANGEVFVLQGGDCAESFDDCAPESIAAKLKVLLQMSLVLVHGTRRPVVRIGRIAGQYAKPRSTDTESRGDVSLPSYRGDLVNRSAFTTEDRTPDPTLMLRGYERAALTLNFIRALADGGFADLYHPEYWDLGFMEHSSMAREYQQVVDSIRESVGFFKAVSGRHMSEVRRVDFYTSHEGLALLYEQAQTRQVPRRDGWYNLSTHLPWIGMRTAQVDSAHVEFFRGIRNPMGVKVGPGMSADWLTELLHILNPEKTPGRLVLIHRMGASKIDGILPDLIETVKKLEHPVVWCSDPMHGNTETTDAGIKTRRFENILSELEQAFYIHTRMGSTLGAVHCELTGENVTECIGGARGLSESDLERAYLSRVDPRLNYEQALELAMSVAGRLRSGS